MARPSQYPLELRRRAVRMAAEVRPDYDTEWAAMKDRCRHPAGDDDGASAQVKAMKKEIATGCRSASLAANANGTFRTEQEGSQEEISCIPAH